MRTTILGLCLASSVLGGCYESHEPGWALGTRERFDDGWIAGDLGALRDIDARAYAIDVEETDGRTRVILHAGEGGGAPFGWAMVAFDVEGRVTDHLPPYETTDLGPTAPIASWACTGPAEGVQEDEYFPVALALMGTPDADAVLVTFEETFESGARLEGGFRVERR